jgi:hypothetical protein
MDAAGNRFSSDPDWIEKRELLYFFQRMEQEYGYLPMRRRFTLADDVQEMRYLKQYCLAKKRKDAREKLEKDLLFTAVSFFKWRPRPASRAPDAESGI